MRHACASPVGAEQLTIQTVNGLSQIATVAIGSKIPAELSRAVHAPLERLTPQPGGMWKLTECGGVFHVCELFVDCDCEAQQCSVFEHR